VVTVDEPPWPVDDVPPLLLVLLPPPSTGLDVDEQLALANTISPLKKPPRSARSAKLFMLPRVVAIFPNAPA
jgi:hypothetical protein